MFRSESFLLYKTCTKFTVMNVEQAWKCGNEMCVCVCSFDNIFKSADQNISGKQMHQTFRQWILIWAAVTYHISSSSLYRSYPLFSLTYSLLPIFLYHLYLYSSWVRSFESLTAGLYCSHCISPSACLSPYCWKNSIWYIWEVWVIMFQADFESRKGSQLTESVVWTCPSALSFS